jgi:hypothetical protein
MYGTMNIKVFFGLWQLNQSWKISSFKGLVCRIKLFIASLHFVLFVWIGNSSFARNFVRNIRTPKQNLQATIREYFPSAKEDVSWFEYPFPASTEYLHRRLRAIEHLTDIAPDRNLIDIFKPTGVFETWSLRRSEYPEIGNRAVQQPLSFVSTYRSSEHVLPWEQSKKQTRS